MNMGASSGSRASTEPVPRLGPPGIDPERKALLRLAREFRQKENQDLHACANAFVRPQPAGEDYHFQRLLAWNVLISDLKDGIPLEKAEQMFAALALGKASQ